MKGTDPIIPPGMNFDGAQRGRSNMRTAVVVVVLLHVALFAGILFQACSKTEDTAETNDGEQQSLAQEMQQIVNQKQPEPTPTQNPSAGSLPALPDAGNGLPPLPANPPAPTGLPPNPSTLGAGTPPVPIHPVATLPAPATTGTQHTVVSGENFWSIARKYGVRHKDIVAANPAVVPTRMKIGQKINIPPKPAPAPSVPAAPAAPAVANTPGTYVVKSGDTLGHIALRHKVKLTDLRALNPNIVPTQMKIGQALKLPTAITPISTGSAPGVDTTPRVDPATGLPILPNR